MTASHEHREDEESRGSAGGGQAGAKEDKGKAGALVKKKPGEEQASTLEAANGSLKPDSPAYDNESSATSGISVDLEGVTLDDSSVDCGNGKVTTDGEKVVYVDSMLVPSKDGAVQGTCHIQVDPDAPEVQVVHANGDYHRTESMIPRRRSSLASGLCGLGKAVGQSLEHAIATHSRPHPAVHHVGGNPEGKQRNLYSYE